MRAIVIDGAGGPDVLELRERPTPVAGPGEVLVDVRAAGVNFFDTAIRTSASAEVPGLEGAGVVAEVGDGVRGVTPGDRVAWMTMNHGSYAEQVVVPENWVVAVPDAVDDETAAALVVQGLSAHHFTTVSHQVRSGEVVLVHAAAGGVGLLITQLAKAQGATVIGLVSRPEKVGIAATAGADHVLVSTGGAFADPVLELTGGEGVHAVFDGAGATTFDASLQVLRTHGTLVFYGPLIGDVPTIRMNRLPRSVRVTYPTTEDHVRAPGDFAARTTELFALVEKGDLAVRIGARYPLAEAARAHTDIESRATTGKLLLIP
ncbi:quinone oxidoreductase [Umezawaea endophytica]|uniref:Quinone oxidoreductase n=1 Tax=Umezawaea endophytica TaxID=1654476 RepID=A0A9X2VJZ3_9PSEU|nr:quinone oxidoreductase [Umezawaea endophytica]MCS7477926.1 quinone oxidoreductase [Umezawaea endophytica]